jgi:hypothetical protein
VDALDAVATEPAVEVVVALATHVMWRRSALAVPTP